MYGVKRVNIRFIAFLELIAVFFLVSCSSQTLQFPKYELDQNIPSSYRSVVDGLMVSIDPMLDKSKIDTFFKSDLQSNNLLAVFVAVENKSSSNAYIVTRDDFSLKSQSNMVGNDPNQSIVGDDTQGKNLANIGAVVLAPILIPISARMISDAGTTRHNFLSKELKTSTTLFPGQSIQGFLYFNLPKNRQDYKNPILMAKIKKLETGDVNEFEFLIDLKGY